MLKKLVVGALILVLVPIGAAWLYWQWFKWGPRPDIHVQGQVIDRESGHGVADAYVILAVRVSKSSLGGTHSGCSEGSAVVRTDKDGKFAYSITAREAFGSENPGSWGVRIYVYHPEFDAALDHDLPPAKEQRLAARRSPDGGWEERPSDLYMTFPHFYDEEKGWATIEVEKRRGSEWQQIDYFTSSPHNKCIEAPIDRGQSELINEIHTRAWDLYCAKRNGASFESRPDEPNVLRAYYFFSSTFYTYLYDVRRKLSEAQRGEITDRRANYVRESILPLYPWGKDDPGFGRAMTFAERENFCAFYEPPLERVLRKLEQ